METPKNVRKSTGTDVNAIAQANQVKNLCELKDQNGSASITPGTKEGFSTYTERDRNGKVQSSKEISNEQINKLILDRFGQEAMKQFQSWLQQQLNNMGKTQQTPAEMMQQFVGQTIMQEKIDETANAAKATDKEVIKNKVRALDDQLN